MSTRKFVIRHLSRDKKDPNDPQTPKVAGEMEAYAMGMILRRNFEANFVKCVSSPLDRATRTAEILLKGWAGHERKHMPVVEIDDGFRDFSSDERFTPLKAEFKAAKGNAAIESECALFLAGGNVEQLRLQKLQEAVAAIDRINVTGDVLVGGLHGGTIDGLYAHYAKQLYPTAKAGMGAFGRQIEKCEGFVLSYDDAGNLTKIEKVERPDWVNAMCAIAK